MAAPKKYIAVPVLMTEPEYQRLSKPLNNGMTVGEKIRSEMGLAPRPYGYANAKDPAVLNESEI